MKLIEAKSVPYCKHMEFPEIQKPFRITDADKEPTKDAVKIRVACVESIWQHGMPKHEYIIHPDTQGLIDDIVEIATSNLRAKLEAAEHAKNMAKLHAKDAREECEKGQSFCSSYMVERMELIKRAEAAERRAERAEKVAIDSEAMEYLIFVLEKWLINDNCGFGIAEHCGCDCVCADVRLLGELKEKLKAAGGSGD